ncbi:MAG: 4-hydroxy-tetrahydrodipicolinate reductase [Deltaproteobacteria bacterium]|nr:4-hydroxy-tetrahydrodipicolinate reductase [Deltaproteobacteria bacterium]
MRVAVVGPTGRMGRQVLEICEQQPGLEVVGRVGKPDEAGAVPISSLEGAAVDVLIDFSHREAVAAHAAFCATHRVAWVLGTTGLDADDEAAVAAAAGETLVFRASNFSVGVALLVDLVARAARILGEDADIEVVESHHHHKVDAPSGTALTLARAAASARGQILEDVVQHGRSGICGARPRGEIGMHALRLGDIVGHHEVHFGWQAEGLVLTHDARDRAVFARGAVRAARWTHARRAAGQRGVVGMAELLADA